MKTSIEVLSYGAWSQAIQDVIAVRTSAYEPWNGPKTAEQQAQEAKTWLCRYSDHRESILFLARVNQEIVGYVIAGERENNQFYISHIGVRSDFKRQGIGRSLLLECEWYAKGRSYLAVTTTTYNRYRGMLLLLIQEGYYIQGTTWVEGAREPRISLRKELKT